MNVIFIRHVEHESGGRFERAAVARGWNCATLHPDEPGAIERAAASDLLVVLGGPMGVYEAEAIPFLRAELDLLRKRLAEKRPVIGVCLGAQLIAEAAGGHVYKGSAGFEVGFGELSRAPGAEATGLGQALPSRFPALHWHGDTFDLPSGATLLASSSRYANQIFAIGRHALGLQCHLEVGRQEIDEFVRGNAADLKPAFGQTPEKILSDAQRYDAQVEAAFQGFFRQFCHELAFN